MTLAAREHKGFQFGDRRVILDVARCRLFELDEPAFRVLQALARCQDREEELARELAGGGPPGEIDEALAELKELDLVTEERPPAPAAEPPPLPPVAALCLHLIHDCNMRCRYCYGQGGQYGTPQESMPHNTAMRAVEFLLSQIPAAGKGSLHLFGGEPLLRWNLLQQLIPYIRRREEEEQKRIVLLLTTNGTLLTKARIRFLHDHGVKVAVSLDGPLEIHDRMRVFPDGTGSYGRILPRLQTLFAIQGHGYLRATLDPRDPQIVQVVDHLLQLGASHVHLEPASARIGDGEGAAGLDGVENLKRDYHRLKDRTIQAIERGTRLPPVDPLARILHLLAGSGQRKTYGCGMGRFYLAVSPRGEFYPCHRLVDQVDYRLGDLKTGLLPGARERYRALHVEHREGCSACWARNLCGGGCYYEGTITRGGVEHPDPDHCALTREMIAVAVEIALWSSSTHSLEIGQVANAFDEGVGHLA